MNTSQPLPTLYLHPLSSFCHKVLIALYENETPFERRIVNLGDPVARDEFKKVWPFAKFPVLHDAARSRTIPESSIIIEYVTIYYPGRVRLIPEDPQQALQVRGADRFYDLQLHAPMQKIVGDKLRPLDGRDAAGVGQAREQMRTALQVAESELAKHRWAAGDEFSMADCAAAPPLFFINLMTPLASEFPCLDSYLERMKQRPAYARVLEEAQPYLSLFPG